MHSNVQVCSLKTLKSINCNQNILYMEPFLLKLDGGGLPGFYKDLVSFLIYEKNL